MHQQLKCQQMLYFCLNINFMHHNALCFMQHSKAANRNIYLQKLVLISSASCLTLKYNFSEYQIFGCLKSTLFVADRTYTCTVTDMQYEFCSKKHFLIPGPKL